MRKTLPYALLAAFYAILLAAPLEGGGVMSIYMRNAMLAGGGWKNPYVTDGLIAMWDGEVFEDEARVVTPQASAEAYLRRIASTTNSAPARLNAARQRLLKTKTDEANGVVSNVTVNLTAGR